MAALHAPGYETPYTSECTECHGVALQGTAQAPSCYSCHENKWDEPTPIELGPVVTQAEWQSEDSGGKLDIEGDERRRQGDRHHHQRRHAARRSAPPTPRTTASSSSKTRTSIRRPASSPPSTPTRPDWSWARPCPWSTKTPASPSRIARACPLTSPNYPGGTYNVFHATAGNKTLVAWPSRFCEQGQPGYAMTTDNADPDRLDAVVSFIQSGNEALGVPALPDFDMARRPLPA